MTLGGKIKDARMRCGLSQAQLAEKLCVSRSAIAKWETDKGLPDIGNLKILSRLLNVSVDYLLDDEEAAQSSAIRESFTLSAYGRGCKKVVKDRVIRDKFPEATIYPLLAQRQIYDLQPEAAVSPCKGQAYGSTKERDREFYLVEQAGKQLLATVTDSYLETTLMQQPVLESSFTINGWSFIKSNYEVD